MTTRRSAGGGADAAGPRPGAGDRRLRLRPRDRELLAAAVRFGRLTAGQAWRWYFPEASGIKTAWNRLGELARAGYLVRVPLRHGQEGLYVPTRAGARVAGCGLAAPRLPGGKDGGAAALLRLGHDLTVAEVARWALRERAVDGAAWRTERELMREQALARPPRERRGGAGLGFRPDGALVLPTGERLAVEVELHDKTERLGEKLAWYRSGRSGDAGVWWLTHRPAVRDALERALRAAGFAPDESWAELLPEGVPVWAD